MSVDRVRRVQEIFGAALELGRDEREDFVARSAPDDDALRAEVLSLLAHADAAHGFLATPALAEDLAPAPMERIGAYEILGVLGQGGMGVVYLARQENPRRLVALKVVRAGFASPRALKRFAHEAEVLGRLNHTGIAHIFEAGTADAGSGPQPFFAMEYVRGANVAEYAAKKALGARARLALVADVCDAVQHAHEQGVIHRDLKPGNVLVEETASGARVKVLDFGVARATESDVRTVTMLTDVGQLVGTLPYMSPEQAAGEPGEVDARSDVYSLGVIAYELLSGRLPHDLRDKRIHEAVRIVREEEPTPLSGHVSILRGDVETIVGKALEKDRARRYASAAALGADIRRWLEDQPIDARPPSRAYQLAKFARRHRVLVAAATCVFVVLAAGIFGTTTQMVRAEHERDQFEGAKKLAEQRFDDAERSRVAAERALKRAEAVTKFQRDMFERAAPGRDGRTVKVADVLDSAAASVGRELAGEPDLEAAVRTSLGRTYQDLGLLPEAERELRAVLVLVEDLYGADHADAHNARVLLADVLFNSSRFAEARALLDTAVEGLAASLGAEHADTLRARANRAGVLARVNEGRLAETEMRSVLAIRQRLLGERDKAVLTAMSSLGHLLRDLGKRDEAEDLLRRALDESLAEYGERDLTTLSNMNNLATFLRQKGALTEAEPLYRRVYEMRREMEGERHYATFTAMNNLAGLLQELGQIDEAETLFRETLRLRLDVLGEEHRDTLTSMNNLGLLLANRKKLDEAEELLRRALAIKRRVLGEKDPNTITSLANVALVQYLRGDVEGALATYREVLAAYEAAHGPRHQRVGQSHENVGGCLASLKRWPEAETELLAAWDVLEETQGAGSTRSRAVAGRLVDLYTSWGKIEDAATWRLKLEH